MCIGYMQILCHFTQKHRWILVSEGVLEPLLLGYRGWLYQVCKQSLQKETEEHWLRSSNLNSRVCVMKAHVPTHALERTHTQTPFLCTRAHTHIPFFCPCAYTHPPFFCTHTHTPHSFAYTHHSFACSHTHTHHSFEQIPYRSHLCNFLLLPFICWDVFEWTRILELTSFRRVGLRRKLFWGVNITVVFLFNHILASGFIIKLSEYLYFFCVLFFLYKWASPIRLKIKETLSSFVLL